MAALERGGHAVGQRREPGIRELFAELLPEAEVLGPDELPSPDSRSANTLMP